MCIRDRSTSDPKGTPDGREPSQESPATPERQSRPDNPNDPTDRGTPQQNTDPRAADPRTPDPRTPDPRASDPRASDPYRDTPTQKEPVGSERTDDPRSDAPDKNPSEPADPTRPDDRNQSPPDDHHDLPSRMNEDSAVPDVPRREPLPDGRNAEAASYVKDSTRGKDPLYGPIAGETNSRNTRPDSEGTTPPRGPSEPAARNDEEGEAFVRRMVDFANASRENRELYWRKDGQRKSLDDRVDDRELPQLKRDPDHPDDEDKFIAVSDAPPPVQPDYMPEDIQSPVERGRERISPEHLAALDEMTNNREWTLAADRITEAEKLKAKEDHGKKSDEYEAVRRPYADTHSAVRDIGEQHGEYSALHHAMASEHPEFRLVEIPRTGNGSDQFDQIYEDPDRPGHFMVVEAKAPSGRLTPRVGHSGQKVMQGTREYFETIVLLMEDGTEKQQEYAEKLKRAYAAGTVQYAVVQSKVEVDPNPTGAGYVGDDGPRPRQRYGGFVMEYFDIRKPEDRQA